MRFTEGRAWLERCPRCESPIVEAHVAAKVRLSTKAVPYSDAVILSKYRIVFLIFIGELQLYVTTWFPSQGPPARGRLYAEHVCGFRR